MVSVTVKNIPEAVYDRVRQSAKANRRSINSEIIVIMEEAYRSRRIDPEEFLVRARELREATARYRITDEELSRAKREGRP